MKIVSKSNSPFDVKEIEELYHHIFTTKEIADLNCEDVIKVTPKQYKMILWMALTHKQIIINNNYYTALVSSKDASLRICHSYGDTIVYIDMET